LKRGNAYLRSIQELDQKAEKELLLYIRKQKKSCCRTDFSVRQQLITVTTGEKL